MADIKDWSPVAANNNDAAPDGWPENMSPSNVNNSARENMAAVRRWYEDAEWRNFGDTATYVSVTSFTVSTDLTARYVANRRIRAVGSTTGTIYGTISSSSYSAPNTTVNVTWDSGSLSSETLAVSLGATPSTNAYPAKSIDGALGLYQCFVNDDATENRLPTGWSVGRPTTGETTGYYRIEHNLGDVNYTVQVTAVNSNSNRMPVARIISRSTVSLTINIQDVAELAPGDFDADFFATFIRWP